jgi:hypothetical protein
MHFPGYSLISKQGRVELRDTHRICTEKYVVIYYWKLHHTVININLHCFDLNTNRYIYNNFKDANVLNIPRGSVVIIFASRSLENK